MRAAAHADRALMIKLATAEAALAEAGEHIADLHRQLTRANQAAVRMARRIVVNQTVRRRA